MVNEDEQMEKWRGVENDYNELIEKRLKAKTNLKEWIEELYKEAEIEGHTDEKDVLKYVNSRQEEQLIAYLNDIIITRSELETETLKSNQAIEQLNGLVEELNKMSSIRGYIVGYEEDSDKVLVSMDGGSKTVYVVPRPMDSNKEDMILGRYVDLFSQDYKIARLKDTYRSEGEKFLVKELPKITYDDIGGLETEKEDIQRYTELQLDSGIRKEMAEAGVDSMNALLLVGPPGTGKTMLAEAIANKANVPFVSVSAPKLVNKYLGQTSSNIADLYTYARENAPCVIFIDEIDGLALKRRDDGGGETDAGDEVRTAMLQLCTEIDGFNKRGEPVVTIFTSNREDRVDDAVISRSKRIEIPTPDRETKLKIYKIKTDKYNLDENLDFEYIVDLTPEDYSGRDIKNVCSDVWLKKAGEAKQAGKKVSNYKINSKDFEAALKEYINLPEEKKVSYSGTRYL
ncbi:MAG: 26S protease regulatory subunit [Candidatus Aenigmarchaeota archaeon]|nr:26S protease regulatory subunit [Candidatus Aenigmarchaeota archaeon]